MPRHKSLSLSLSQLWTYRLWTWAMVCRVRTATTQRNWIFLQNAQKFIIKVISSGPNAQEKPKMEIGRMSFCAQISFPILSYSILTGRWLWNSSRTPQMDISEFSCDDRYQSTVTKTLSLYLKVNTTSRIRVVFCIKKLRRSLQP